MPPPPAAVKAPPAAVEVERLDVSVQGKGDGAKKKKKDGDSDSADNFVRITPLSGVTDFWGGPTRAGAEFNGTYTKIVISSSLAKPSGTARESQAGGGGDSADILGYKPRVWWKRALWGTDFNIALTAKLHVGSNIDLTVPLAVIGHQSNSAGEAWVRELDASKSDFPLFLYRSDGTSVPSVTVEIKGSNSISSRGAALGISAITNLAKLAGAEPSVITKLTESSTKTASAAVDTAISNLMNSSITERYVSDRNLMRWSSGDESIGGGLSVEFSLPTDEESWNSKSALVGRWYISFARPRPSAFFEWSVCPDVADAAEQVSNRCSTTLETAQIAVKEKVSANDVLHYKLLSNANGLGDVDSYIAQQKWFTDAVAALAKSSADADQKDKFCQSVVGSITGLGLNEFDGRLVLWAINTAMPSGLPNLNSTKCRGLLTGFRDLSVVSPQAPAAGKAQIGLSWDGDAKRKSWSDQLLASIRQLKTDLDAGHPESFAPGYSTLSADMQMKFWAELMIAISYAESQWNPALVTRGPAPANIDSVGLLQLSYKDADSFPFEPLDSSKRSLEDPLINLRCGLVVMAALAKQDGVVASGTGDKSLGGARYWKELKSDQGVAALLAKVKAIVGLQ